MNIDFRPENYLPSIPIDDSLSPDVVVLEYIRTYKRWAKDCHYWAKENREKVGELSKGSAKNCLKEIQSMFLTSVNRQYQRNSSGYYFYGGTYDVNPEIEAVIEISKNEVLVITSPKRNVSPKYRFGLKRIAKRWRITTLERNAGPDRWSKDVL